MILEGLLPQSPITSSSTSTSTISMDLDPSSAHASSGEVNSTDTGAAGKKAMVELMSAGVANPETLPTLQRLISQIAEENKKQTRFLFSQAYRSRGAERMNAIKALREFAGAQMLLEAAVDEYRMKGNMERLQFASNTVASYPLMECFSAIESLVERDNPEAGSFVGVVDYLDAPIEVRRRLYNRLLVSRNPEVRAAADSVL